MFWHLTQCVAHACRTLFVLNCVFFVIRVQDTGIVAKKERLLCLHTRLRALVGLVFLECWSTSNCKGVIVFAPRFPNINFTWHTVGTFSFFLGVAARDSSHACSIRGAFLDLPLQQCKSFRFSFPWDNLYITSDEPGVQPFLGMHESANVRDVCNLQRIRNSVASLAVIVKRVLVGNFGYWVRKVFLLKRVPPGASSIKVLLVKLHHTHRKDDAVRRTFECVTVSLQLLLVAGGVHARVKSFDHWSCFCLNLFLQWCTYDVNVHDTSPLVLMSGGFSRQDASFVGRRTLSHRSRKGLNGMELCTFRLPTLRCRDCCMWRESSKSIICDCCYFCC